MPKAFVSLTAITQIGVVAGFTTDLGSSDVLPQDFVAAMNRFLDFMTMKKIVTEAGQLT